MTFESGAPEVLVESAPLAIVEMASNAMMTVQLNMERLMNFSNLIR